MRCNFLFSGDIKRICETDLGLISQCCLTKHVFKISKQYLANVSLKINVKVLTACLYVKYSVEHEIDNMIHCVIQMGGRNTVLLDAISWRIPLVSDIPTIIFGADVTHPETGEDSSPSIAAVRVIMILLFHQQYTSSFSSVNLRLGFRKKRKSLPLSNMLVAGCCISRLARSYKVCWIGLCSGTSARAHSGPLQDMA